MRKKSLILISLTLCLIIGLTACGRKPVDEAVNNTVTTSTPEVKNEMPKEEVKVETPKKEEPKQEVKKEAPKQEVKKETPKEVQKPAATNSTTVNTSKPVEQPKTVVPTTTTTTEPVITAPTVNIYAERHIDENSLIRNSNDFKVTLSTLTAKSGDNITIKVESSSPKNLYIYRAEVYGNGMYYGGANAQWSSDKKTYTDNIVVQNWKPQDGGKVDSYIFITDNDTKKQYEYRFTLNIQQ